jgi:hypothetical protein
MTLKYTMKPIPQNIQLPDTFTVDHNKFFSEASFRQTRYSDRLFYTDAQTELNILVSALIASGDVPQAVFKTESPDFRVVLRDSNEVFVEITTAIATSEARADNVIADLSFALSSWAQADPKAERRIEGFALSFLIPHPPSASETDATLKEMQEFILEADLAKLDHSEVSPIPDNYCRLTKLGTKLICLRQGVTFVQVSRGAMSVEPPSASVDIVYDAIRRKRDLAVEWPQPLWLIVWITGHYYSPDDMLSAFRLPDDNIAPFKRIYVGGARSVLVVT